MVVHTPAVNLRKELSFQPFSYTHQTGVTGWINFYQNIYVPINLSKYFMYLIPTYWFHFEKSIQQLYGNSTTDCGLDLCDIILLRMKTLQHTLRIPVHDSSKGQGWHFYGFYLDRAFCNMDVVQPETRILFRIYPCARLLCLLKRRCWMILLEEKKQSLN